MKGDKWSSYVCSSYIECNKTDRYQLLATRFLCLVVVMCICVYEQRARAMHFKGVNLARMYSSMPDTMMMMSVSLFSRCYSRLEFHS